MGSAPGDAVSAPPFPGIPLHEPVSALDSSSRLRPGSQGFSARAAAPLPRGVPSPSSPQPWRVPGGHPLTVPCGRTALGPVRASSVRRPPRTSQGPLVCTFSPADPRPAPDPAKGPGRFEGRVKFLRVHSALQNWVTGSVSGSGSPVRPPAEHKVRPSLSPRRRGVRRDHRSWMVLRPDRPIAWKLEWGQGDGTA